MLRSWIFGNDSNKSKFNSEEVILDKIEILTIFDHPK
jgi:hypothetical protein